ncbi:hypothetical protein niasHT_021020 [Heterodera trifolii]|uniref:Homeobox domain-containing protein n=1 Tax=Heterodera trifolii TaxID=157864 RepID=A0ABD2KCX4_9BILA
MHKKSHCLPKFVPVRRWVLYRGGVPCGNNLSLCHCCGRIRGHLKKEKQSDELMSLTMSSNPPANVHNINNTNNNNNTFVQIPSLAFPPHFTSFPAPFDFSSATFSAPFQYHGPSATFFQPQNSAEFIAPPQFALTPAQPNQPHQQLHQAQQHFPFRHDNGMNADQQGSVEENGAEDGAKSIRKRVLFTADQVAQLERRYKENTHINRDHRNALARRCGLRPDQVKIWFQNKRYKEKKKRNDVKFLCSISSSVKPKEGGSSSKMMTTQNNAEQFHFHERLPTPLSTPHQQSFIPTFVYKNGADNELKKE